MTAFQLLLHACELPRRTLCPLHFMSTVLSGSLKQIVLYPIQSTMGAFLGPILHPGQTAAVAVVSFWASDRLRFRTLELLIVSKWDSGTQPRCRSESLVPSTQSVESKETNIKQISYPCCALIYSLFTNEQHFL